MNVAARERTVSPAVIFVHGWGSTSERTWGDAPLLKYLVAAGRIVVKVDLLGHGNSPAPHDPQRYVVMAEALARHLPPTGVVDAVGFSLGAKLLLRLAVDEPSRLRRLVVLGVGENVFRPENGPAIAQALLTDSGPDTPAAIRPVVDEAKNSGNDLRALAAVIQRPASVLTPSELATITAEVLLVAGTDDAIAGHSDYLASMIPSCRYLRLVGVDHLGTTRSAYAQQTAAQFLTQA